MKLLPRFSLRTGLITLTAVAFLAVSLRAAALGESWAIGAGVGVLSIPALLLLHSLFYLAARICSRGNAEADPAEPPAVSSGASS